MASLTSDNVGLRHLSAAVPARIIDNLSYTSFFSSQDAKEVVDKTGIKERRFAEDGVCSSDLCEAAANRIFEVNPSLREEIDLLIFISQTPDYRMPATSVLLQHRLGLPKSVMAFDINLGCSAFVYGLSVAYSLVSQMGLRKALVLDGETRSRVYSPKDRKTAFLFGDGGVAAVVEQSSDFGKAYFDLGSDGSKGDLIKMNAGGYRIPSSPETLEYRTVDEYGNQRKEEHGYMNGADVFNFVLAEIPASVKRVLQMANKEKEHLDFFVLHQANEFMNDYLAKKLKLPKEKVPKCLSKFGNTSSVSIPLTIVSELQGNTEGVKDWLLSGFGVGMSWATAVIRTKDLQLYPITEI